MTRTKDMQLYKQIKNVMSEHEAIGLAISAFNRGGEILYQNCFGHRDIEKDLPVNADTVFGLASITKSFTCLSIMQLAEKGIIDINQPVSAYIPELSWQEITLHHLMSNSSGIPMQTQKGREKIIVSTIAEQKGFSPEKDGDLAYNEAFVKAGADVLISELSSSNDFAGKPGETYNYGNDGFSLLSEIIRRYSNEKTYASYVKKEILEPLGMMRSGGGYTWGNDDNISLLYDGDGNIFDTHHNSTSMMGNGGLKSTINDMKKYVCMYMNMGKNLEGKTIINPDIIAQMTKQRIQMNADNIYAHYGYGLMVAEDFPRRIFHSGGMTGISSYMVWSNDKGVGVVVLCNTNGVDVHDKIGLEVLKYYCA